MDSFVTIFHWINILSILVALIFLLFSTKRYNGVIGVALTYLSVGIIINALVAVADLLALSVDFNAFHRLAGPVYGSALHSLIVTFSFLMIAAGFYKLSKIYKRL